MRVLPRISLALLLLALSVPASVHGQGRGRGDSPEVEGRRGDRGLGDEVERIIRDWFRDGRNLEGLPPGLAKRDQLPPGLQRQLVRNGRLPPGLESRVQGLPPDLETRLPRLPDNRRRIFLGGNVILLDTTTSLILDVLENVL